GAPAAQIFDGNRVFEVSVLLDPAQRQDIGDVASLPLRNPQGETVLLGQLADIQQSEGRAEIRHTGGQRLQIVTADVVGRPVSQVVDDARAQISRDVALPNGTYVAFTGEAQARAQSQRDLLVNALIAGIAIVLLLFVALRSSRALVLVLANLPFALVGGVLTVLLTGGDLTLGSMIGFVTLFGITLRNSIMLISHYEHLVNFEGMTWGPEAARRGAAERVTPILMTALVTAVGLLPLALYRNAPGNEIEGPLAIVILGGLVTSTALNLIVLPILALRFGQFASERHTATS
ncbi:MAG: efflux RND transporter permease subunit, partial [Terriglobia bacterium]